MFVVGESPATAGGSRSRLLLLFMECLPSDADTVIFSGNHITPTGKLDPGVFEPAVDFLVGVGGFPSTFQTLNGSERQPNFHRYIGLLFFEQCSGRSKGQRLIFGSEGAFGLLAGLRITRSSPSGSSAEGLLSDVGLAKKLDAPGNVEIHKLQIGIRKNGFVAFRRRQRPSSDCSSRSDIVLREFQKRACDPEAFGGGGSPHFFEKSVAKKNVNKSFWGL